jgi:hypothetical protein
MSCSNNITPCGCGSNPCGCGTSSNDVVYQGPDLSCTGVTNCDTLTEVIQTIDGFICSPEMVENIINNILNNPNLYNQFTSIVNNTVDCETVWDCIDSRTTTTTSSSSTSTSTSTSTTTTTTAGPTTTTTTTEFSAACTCLNFNITQEDIDNAVGNVLYPNNAVLVSINKGALCGGGDFGQNVTSAGTIDICIETSEIGTVEMYYYVNDIPVFYPATTSTYDVLYSACTTNGECVPTTTTTTTTVV